LHNRNNNNNDVALLIPKPVEAVDAILIVFFVVIKARETL